MSRMIIKGITAVVVLIIAGASAIAATGFADNEKQTVDQPSTSTVGPTQKVSDELREFLRSHTASIETPYGTFNKVPDGVINKNLKTVYKEYDVSEDTEQIVLDSGVFVK